VNELDRLLNLSEEEKRSQGVLFTPGEIYQQPRMWEATLGIVRQHAPELKMFLRNCGLLRGADLTVYLLGAGTSEYVGNAVADTLRRHLGVTCVSLPTTTFIPSPGDWIQEGKNYLFVYFARSGDSPESIGSYDTVHELAPEAHHLVITCNRDGALAKAPARDDRLFVLCLPDETNDRSLVMTSSFSSMAVAAIAIAHLDSLDDFQADLLLAANAARGLLEKGVDEVRRFAAACGRRMQYLGTGGAFGTMQECRLKVLEMTAGKIAANADTYLGLRHGPQVFVNEECGVVASLSSDESRRRYELDLLKELQSKAQGRTSLCICDRKTRELELLGGTIIELNSGSRPVPDELRVVTDVIVGQLIGLFKSIELSLKPDSPSEGGIINRVVTGVRIYPIQRSQAL
ncbi:MAG TPA: hypothetical protein VMW69_05825, partial [Spirochaetia bacterium]|nr:hypothetical protein [Spirochaetia bacterium]